MPENKEKNLQNSRVTVFADSAKGRTTAKQHFPSKSPWRSAFEEKMHAVKSMERRFDRQKEEFLDYPEQEDAIFLAICKRVRSTRWEKGAGVFRRKAGSGKEGSGRESSFKNTGTTARRNCGKKRMWKNHFSKKDCPSFLERKDLKAAYMPQNYEESMDLEKTAVEFLTKTGEREEEKRIRTYLGSMKYTADEMVHPMKELSGGQKAKLFFPENEYGGKSGAGTG